MSNRAKLFAQLLTVVLLAGGVIFQAASPALAGTAQLSVGSWSRDQVTGVVSYNITLTATGLADSGGSCQSPCEWFIEGWHKNGSTDQMVQQLARQSEPAGTSTLTRTITSTGYTGPEITHVRARIKPTYTYSPNQKLYTDWIQVATPAVGGVGLSVGKWLQEGTSVSYHLTVLAWEASRWKAPCDTVCDWTVHAWDKSGPTDVYVGELARVREYYRPWTLNRAVTGSGSYANATHLRVTLKPYYSGYETFYRDVFVGDHTQADSDMMPYEGALGAALVAAPASFCDVLALAGGASLDGDSSPDIWQRCVLAVETHGAQIRKVLAFMAGTVGFAVAIDQLLDEHANEGSSPNPQEEENPPLPWAPGPNDQDNGCEQQVVTIDQDDRNHVEQRHSWYSTEGASRYFDWVNWEWLASVYALKERAVPSGGRCVRWVNYIRTIGVDMDNNFAPTSVYSVVTEVNGDLVTTHPGYATIWP